MGKCAQFIKVFSFFVLFFYFSFFVRGQSDVDGQWSAPIGFDIVPVAVANMPDGRLLTWAASSPTGFVEVSSGPTYTEIFDPSLGVSGAPLGQFVSNLGHDMFCPGINLLPDGRIMAAGGATSDRTSIFDPGTETWSAADRMNIPRGYQGNVTLSDGSVFTLGGSWADGNSPSANGQKDAEQWSPQTGWFKLPGILGADIFTSNDLGMEARGLYRVDNHLWLWPAPNGQLFHAGPSEEMHWIDVSGNGSITSAGLRGDDTYSMKGTTVMFDQGKILKVGGAESYDSDHPAKNTAFVIDINDPGNVTVTPTPTLAFSRTMLNSVVLPNGEVLVTGGLDQAKVFTDVGARFFGEIYDPVSNTWRTVAGMNEARTYHSVSILMSDGRVFVGGGGLCDSTPGCVNHQSAEVYSPPYLFTTGGALATRPVITNAPDQADYGEGIAITTDIAVGEFSLIRFSGATHSTNNEQRRIPIATVPGTSHNLTIPGRNLLPPGYYMLFALDANGVPSVSKSIRIGNAVPLANNPNLVLDLGFEEGTGTVAADGSGNNNDATIVERDDNGTVVVPTQSYWGDGLFGDHALEMDGLEFNSNAILEVPFSTSMASIETEITVMSWVYRDEIEKNNGIFSHDYPSIFFGFHNSLYKWEFPSSTGDNPHCYAGYSPVGKWVHIAATFDGETARLYANGTEICTKSVTGTFNLEEIEQFYSSFTASGFYDKRALPVVPTGNSSGITDEIDGRLDELKVFKKALGDEEIKMFFQLGQQTGNPDVPDCPEGTIVAEFKVGDGAWTQGEYINAPEGSVVLIRAQTAGDYFITTHQVDGPTFSSVTVPEYQIDTGVDVFGLPPYDNPDRNNGLVDQSNKGQFVLTTAGGCATVITLNVGGVCEAGETEIMPEYTVNGVTGSGENELTLDEGTLLVISASPDDIDGTPLGIAITLPNGSTVEGDYAPGNISGLEHEGVYLITSDQGCSTTLTVNIVEPADGCYDIFENEDTDFPLEVGTYEAGLSSAFGTSADTNASPCAFEVVQSDSGQPWSRYRIAIDLAQHGLSPGDELFVSVDGKGIGGTARMELIVDNTANSALLSHSFGTGWGTYSGTVTVPDGASTLDLWLFSNYAGQTQGNSRYDNLVVSRIASDGPSAVIDASVLEGEVPLSVDFTGSGSTDDIGVTGYDWDFGDGASSTQADPSHQYTEIGTYQVTLTVSDIDGNTDTDTVQIKVNPVGGSCSDTFENEDLLISLPLGTYEAGLSSAFGTSADTNASPCAFEVVQSDSGQPWSRYRIAIDLAQHGLSPGDELFVSVDGKGIGGTARMELIVDNTANSALLSHSFGTGWGTYSGTVTVPDGASTLDLWLFSNYAGQTQGNSRYDNLVVSRIASDGPSAVIDASVLEGEVPLSVDFTGSGSTDDIGVTGYDWDFGDGASSTQADPSHQYTEIGTYQVTLTVSDIDGNTDTDTVQIKVNPVGGSCSDTFENEDLLISLPLGTYEAGLDSVFGTSADTNASPCAFEVVQSDSGQPWSRYRIAIDLAQHGLSPGDELFVSVDGKGIGGTARMELIVDNTANSALLSHSFGTGWGTYSGTVTVPDGASTLDLWLFPNYAGQSPGNSRYDNLVVSRIASDGPSAVIDASVLEGEVPLSVDFTGSGSTDDIGVTGYDWDFGDGASSTQADPSHQYTEIGTYQVTLTVSDIDGNTDTDTVQIKVNPVGGSCSDTFENEDLLISLPLGTYEAGLDSVFGTSADTNASPCAFEVVQSDSGQPWSRYRIAIDLAQHGLSPGDELFVSVDGKGIGGTARMELIVDNTANSALLSHSFGTGWGTYSGTVTVPDGASTLDLWLFSNYAGQSPGNSRYDNLVVQVSGEGTSSKGTSNIIEDNDSVLLNQDTPKAGRLVIFPNPSSGIINLDLSPYMNEAVSCTIASASQQLVFSKVFNEQHKSIEVLDFTTLSNGVYYITITTPSQEISGAFIVSK